MLQRTANLAAVGVTTLGLIATTVSTAHAATAADSEKREYVVACNSPGETANFSWNGGTTDTKVFYNNHCSHTVKVTVHLFGGVPDPTECLSVPAHTKGNERYNHGALGGLDKLTRGC